MEVIATNMKKRFEDKRTKRGGQLCRTLLAGICALLLCLAGPAFLGGAGGANRACLPVYAAAVPSSGETLREAVGRDGKDAPQQAQETVGRDGKDAPQQAQETVGRDGMETPQQAQETGGQDVQDDVQDAAQGADGTGQDGLTIEVVEELSIDDQIIIEDGEVPLASFSEAPVDAGARHAAMMGFVLLCAGAYTIYFDRREKRLFELRRQAARAQKLWMEKG